MEFRVTKDHSRPRRARASSRNEQDDSPSKRLLALVATRTREQFHTNDREVFITFADKHEHTWGLESDDLKHLLSGIYFEAEGEPINPAELCSALSVLKANALFKGRQLPVYVRVAQHSNSIYLDLANDLWEAVEVTAAGWDVVRNPPVKFRRNRGVLSLRKPERGGSIEELRSFVNTETDEQWILLVSWLVAAMRPVGPYPLLALESMHGTAKSCATRLLKAVIDPCSSPLRSAPRNVQDLMIAARNGWVLAYDNFSGVPAWLSDAFCRLSTGGGLGTRQLYSDAGEILFNATRPVIVNGIDIGIQRGDLLDRTMKLGLPRIDERNRMTESRLWADFERVTPRILGALLDGLSTAMQRMTTLSLSSLPRMADFATWATAAETAFGWPEGAFQKAYSANQQDLSAIALETSPLLEPLTQLCAEGGWEGTTQDLLSRLSDFPHDTRGWPTTARDLSTHLRRLAPNLLDAGIAATVSQTAGANSKKLWRIVHS